MDRQIAALIRHEKTEREQLSALIEHKQSLKREIEWIQGQRKTIQRFIANVAPTLDKCLCEGLSGSPLHHFSR